MCDDRLVVDSWWWTVGGGSFDFVRKNRALRSYRPDVLREDGRSRLRSAAGERVGGGRGFNGGCGSVAAVIVLRGRGIADGAAVEVEFVDAFFADEDFNDGGRAIRCGRVDAGCHFGVAGGGGAGDLLPVEEDLEDGGVVGGCALGDGEVDVAGDVIAGGECSSEVGLERNRSNWRLGGRRSGGFCGRCGGGGLRLRRGGVDSSTCFPVHSGFFE